MSKAKVILKDQPPFYTRPKSTLYARQFDKLVGYNQPDAPSSKQSDFQDPETTL